MQRKGKARVPCPKCKGHDNEVLRVRCRPSDHAVVRRHQCACGHRFTSTQRVDAAA